MQEDHTIAPGI